MTTEPTVPAAEPLAGHGLVVVQWSVDLGWQWVCECGLAETQQTEDRAYARHAGHVAFERARA